jgi:hypothetical protein
MPSASYQVFINDQGALGASTGGCYSVTGKTTTGFSVRPINCSTAANLSATSAFAWMAIADK